MCVWKCICDVHICVLEFRYLLESVLVYMCSEGIYTSIWGMLSRGMTLKTGGMIKYQREVRIWSYHRCKEENIRIVIIRIK